ncbi:MULTISPECIES: hypothetical protein [unclassified Lysobacter]|uniref:hypothetical protein n=1 Tax=unclassified Lysobacter TaxID=2635362 RepID=UPI001BECF7B5|nr:MULTISPECIES: hypothetical protein [unclassified Lysobacter]MBT2746833.1 hypothetical protein [Lysobacter sp. ISL-42]MBT2750682.1 hypothetical protein [Lysobacter sp. ISL-50]MBT2779511.1 hypothetical protein [Lysobacter sp. ISL-54]MBT2784655.1 hypothetical protein [Lysobacter sp. ISL-52]
MRTLALAILICSASAANAVEPSTDTDFDAEDAASTFIRCASLYSWLSQSLELAGKPNAIEHIRGLQRGAKTAASWFLSVDHNEKHPKDLRNIGSWDSYLDPQIETSVTRLRALREVGDQKALDDESKICVAMIDVQADVVNTIRREVSDKNAKQP